MAGANFTFRLNTGDAGLKLERFAMDSATVRQAWGNLPADLRYAQNEMLKLGTQQVRMGHLRSRERQHLSQFQDRQLQHHTRLTQVSGVLSQRIGRDPLLSQYRALEASGGLNAAMRGSSGLTALHAQMGQFDTAQGQLGAIGGTNTLLGQYGVSSQFNRGNAASYWGRTAMFGRGADGTPNTGGQWAKQKLVGGFQRTRRRIGQVATMFAGFQALKTLTTSMTAFETKAVTIQRIGSRLGNTIGAMGDSFAYVNEVISGKPLTARQSHALRGKGRGSHLGASSAGGIRRTYGYTLGQVAPGLDAMAKYTGSLASADGATRFARALGLDPSGVMSQHANMAQYGHLDYSLIEGGVRGTGMRSRPELYSQWLGSTQQQLGAGFMRAPLDQSLSYMRLVGDAGGDPYRNQRGIDLTGRMIGGLRQTGGGALFAAKMSAVSGLGNLHLGGNNYADTSTYRGMRKALESGHTSVMEAMFAEAGRLGGGGELNREVFQGLLGNTMNVHESDMIYKQMAANGGKMLSGSGGGTLDGDLAAVMNKGNLAFRIQQTSAEMELDVYERIGEVLRPVSVDFKTAALIFAQRVAGSADTLNTVGNILEGVSDAVYFMTRDGPEGATSAGSAIFEISLAQDTLLGNGIVQLLKYAAKFNGAMNQ